MVLVVLGGCSTGNALPGSGAPSGGCRQVSYTTQGNAQSGLSVTMQTPSGQSQQTNVRIGDEFAYCFPAGAFLYFSAQNNGDGRVECIINVDGREVSRNLGLGAYAIATCSA